MGGCASRPRVLVANRPVDPPVKSAETGTVPNPEEVTTAVATVENAAVDEPLSEIRDAEPLQSEERLDSAGDETKADSQPSVVPAEIEQKIDAGKEKETAEEVSVSEETDAQAELPVGISSGVNEASSEGNVMDVIAAETDPMEVKQAEASLAMEKTDASTSEDSA